ncbi:MAG: NAD(P)/FAD-dependent oxidoreductase [Deltaproteobacteria bacterium]|nr:NAD(P)/FAD-dependent oxidoreductase [Deltaproteobacteria bacterium]
MDANVTMIGAGVVGLAIARELSQTIGGVFVLEKNAKFGQETSSRNSEVIHAGIYYHPGSLKARFCVEGARLLYDYCASHQVPHKKKGKLVVATKEEELAILADIENTSVKNGAADVRIIDASAMKKLEPGAKGIAAIYSPHTGIVDSHALMHSLFLQALAQGAEVIFNTEVSGIEKLSGGYALRTKNNADIFTTRLIINCAGLYADKMAILAGIDIDSAGYRLRYCKGSYFSYAQKSPVEMLVYPVPHQDLAGLGVHATLDLSGRLRFGPDVEDVESIVYAVDENKREAFFIGAEASMAGLESRYFLPDTAGIRPKIAGAGFKDFVIAAEADKGLPGFINLIGIESPGLTASLAIARHVKEMVSQIG